MAYKAVIRYNNYIERKKVIDKLLLLLLLFWLKNDHELKYPLTVKQVGFEGKADIPKIEGLVKR